MIALMLARFCLSIAMLILAADVHSAAESVRVHGAWMPVASGTTATALPDRDDPAWRSFEPNAISVVPRGALGAWVRLDGSDGWPSDDLVLSISTPPYGAFTLFDAAGRAVRNTSLMDLDPLRWHGHGRVAMSLDAGVLARPFVLLRLEPAERASSGMSFRIDTVAGFARMDSRWLAFASASLAILFGMSMMAICFGILLRDTTFFFYAAYVLSYAMIQVVQTGFAAHPLGVEVIAANPRVFGISALLGSVVAATLFVDRFVDLRRHAPRLRIVVLATAGAVVLNSLFAFVPFDSVRLLSRALVNPLLIVIGPLLLLCGVVALLRGSRYAIYFLIGWTPLLVLTVLSSLQTFGILAHWTQSNDFCIAAAAFEALVLSLGLADRALALRREGERIGVLAETDPLTGLYNRRAWIDRAQALLDTMRREGNPLCVMFLDLDHFKQLNDSRGHEAGDKALVRVAELMRTAMRHREVIGRLGGEEFVVVLPDCALPAATEVAERVRLSLEGQAIALGTEGGVLTTCIGVAERSAGENLARLIARADTAMYAAKSAGRNRVVVADTLAVTR